MIYLAIAAITAAATIVETKFLLAYLKDRDEKERAERSELLTRIQAPHVAPSLGLVPDDAEPVLSDDEAEVRELVHEAVGE